MHLSLTVFSKVETVHILLPETPGLCPFARTAFQENLKTVIFKDLPRRCGHDQDERAQEQGEEAASPDHRQEHSVAEQTVCTVLSYDQS